MKRILCYGDSNVWGFDPVTFTEGTPYFLRYGEDVRWTMKLQSLLGEGYTVIEEGLGGRTTLLDDPYEEQDLNGLKYLKPCLGSHAPIDLVVMLLGTNDLKTRFAPTAFDIAYGIEYLIRVIRKSGFGPEGKAPEILLLCPASLTEDMYKSCIKDLFNVPEVIRICKELPDMLKGVAERNQCYFLKCDDYVTVSDIDYVHFTSEGHIKLAEGIAEKIRQIYEK